MPVARDFVAERLAAQEARPVALKVVPARPAVQTAGPPVGVLLPEPVLQEAARQAVSSLPERLAAQKARPVARKAGV